jgi:hypothetical protein
VKKVNQRKYRKIQSFTVLAVLCTMLAMPTLANANASTVAILTVIPTSNSNAITVIGNGFNLTEPVYLALANTTTGLVVYNFTESITTSSIGTFTANVILPPATYGTYLVYAKTSTVSASKEYTIINPTATPANPKVTVSPPNSNIIKVVGNGFSPMDAVAFMLLDSNRIPVYNFTDFAITDTQGNFTVTLIVPTSMHGNHTLIAATRTGNTVNAAITVPDLTGPKGDTGDTGAKGAKGATGAAGTAADNTLLYAAIIISVIAAIISVVALLRDREPDDEDD